MDLTCVDGVTSFDDFLFELLDTRVIWPGIGPNACILETFSSLSSDVRH